MQPRFAYATLRTPTILRSLITLVPIAPKESIMVAQITHKPFSSHNVLLDNDLVGTFRTRKEALALVNSLLSADFARMDLQTEGHARLWKKLYKGSE